MLSMVANSRGRLALHQLSLDGRTAKLPAIYRVGLAAFGGRGGRTLMTPPATVGGAAPRGPKRLRLTPAWTMLIACVCALGFMAIAADAAAAERQIGAAKLVVHNVTGALGSEAPPVVLRAGIDVFQNEIIKTDQNS